MAGNMNFEALNFKQFQKILKANGYTLDRVRGSHYIYKAVGKQHISINKNLNPCVALRLIKENNLNIHC